MATFCGKTIGLAKIQIERRDFPIDRRVSKEGRNRIKIRFESRVS